MYSIAGTRDMYKPLPVNDTPRSFYNVIRAFAGQRHRCAQDLYHADQLFLCELRHGSIAGQR